MTATTIDFSKLKTLEHYATALTLSLISLQTLCNCHVSAVKAGILTEDLECRCQTLIWDYKRQMKLTQDQLASVLELLPDDFKVMDAVEELGKTKKPKRKKK